MGLETDFTFENGTCAEGYDITEDGQVCIGGDSENCNDNSASYQPLCNGDRGRDGSIFCDVYATFTGSRIAHGRCYDKNDNPSDYCDKFHEEEMINGDGWTCESLCANYDAVVAKGEIVKLPTVS